MTTIQRWRKCNWILLKMYNELYHLAFPSQRKNYFHKYREQFRMFDQLYRLAFPEEMRVYNKRAERKRRRTPARRAYMASFEKIYARAKELRQWFDVVVDHIIPLARGGKHSPGNLQIIYRLDNLRKGVNTNYVPSVIFT